MRLLNRTMAMLSLALTGATGLAAQNTLSLHAGASIATLGGSDISNASSRTGLNVGAALTFDVAPNVGLQLGGGYVQKGATASEQGVSIEFAIDYVEVPLLLRLAVPTTGAISPHFMAGPAVAFKTKCDATASGQGASITVKCDDPNIDIPLKSTDFGGMVGAGLDIGTHGPVSLTLDALYNIGFTSIDDSSDSADVKNRAWSILAGVAFPLGLR